MADPVIEAPYRALAFEKSQDVRHTVFGWNGNEHMHVIGHEMTRLDHTFLLLCQAVKDISQVPSDHPIEDFLSVLRCKNHMILAIPRTMVQVIRDCRHGRSPM